MRPGKVERYGALACGMWSFSKANFMCVADAIIEKGSMKRATSFRHPA